MAANVNRPILLAALLFLLNATRFVEAQPSPPVGGYGFSGVSFNSTAVSIIIAIVAFFFFALFSICVRRSTAGRFSSPRIAQVGAVSWRSNRASIGLDPTVLDAFPIFVYSRVKALKIGTGALECAVCLSEFKDDDTLRLLPSCSHAFHADCIDMWLASHVTCPVCRSDLTAAGSLAVDGHRVGGEEEVSVGQVAISVDDDGTGPMMGKGEGTLPRSHTTGHDERYTLRLPEHVRAEIGGLRRSASCVAFPVMK